MHILMKWDQPWMRDERAYETVAYVKDGKVALRFTLGEREDRNFDRDLHACPGLLPFLEEVYRAGVRGETLTVATQKNDVFASRGMVESTTHHAVHAPPVPSRDVAGFAVAQLARLEALPCRVDAMTPREYAIYQVMAPAIAALQALAERGSLATMPSPGLVPCTTERVT